jgi:glyoxylase-like metal-dependent hydrolase (beta-lactamase superfamily II)
VRLRAVYTPGHAGNHLCWMLDDHGLLLTGDHVMHGSTVVIKPPDGDMVAYLASLQRLLDMGTRLVSIGPGHGRVIADPHGTVEAIVAHRLDRERVVAEALARAGPCTVGELVARVYADVRPVLFAMARFSLWAHLRKLAADGAVTVTTVGRPDIIEASTPAVPAAASLATTDVEPAVANAAAADHPELHWVWEAV